MDVVWKLTVKLEEKEEFLEKKREYFAYLK